MPFDTPQTGVLGALGRPDPMRAIIAGLRQSATPGTINQVGSEQSFYGQGDPLDIAIAEEQRRTERARADQRLALSDASWVDPRIERDDPTTAAKIRSVGSTLAAQTKPIEDGPLTAMLDGGRMVPRTLPMLRGAERTENTLDANAEANNFTNPAQVGMRQARRGETLQDAQQTAANFMDPAVSQARKTGVQEQTDASLAVARDPKAQGFDILKSYLAQLAGNPYPTAGVPGLTDLAQLFGIDTNGVKVAGGEAPTAATPGADQSMTYTRQRVAQEAAARGIAPTAMENSLRARGYTIVP
jgi:hypothetical protein